MWGGRTGDRGRGTVTIELSCETREKKICTCWSFCFSQYILVEAATKILRKKKVVFFWDLIECRFGVRDVSYPKE